MTREEAIKKLNAIKEYLIAGNPIWDVREIDKVFDMVVEELQAEPVKHGEWQVDEAECIYGKKYIITCSECGESVSVTEAALPYEKYCRNCGAKMNGGKK